MKVKVLKPFPAANDGELKVGAVFDVPCPEIPTAESARSAIQSGYLSEVKEEALKETPAPSRPSEGAEIKDISEVIPKAVDVEGEQRSAEELVGKVIVIEKFGMRPSKFEGSKEYATIQIIEPNGAKAWLNTSSKAILETLNEAESLPVRCKIAKKKSEAGQRYYTLESAKETK